MTKRYFSGATEAQAILEAATHFGVEPEAVSFEPVSRKGSLRARTRSIIAVDDEAPVKVTVPTERPAPKAAQDVPAPATKLEDVPRRAETPVPVSPDGEAVPKRGATAEASPSLAGESMAGGTGPVDTVSGGDSSASTAPAPAVPVARPQPAKETSEDSEEEPPVDPAKVKAAVLAAMESLLDLADLDVDPTVKLGEGEPEVNVTGADREWLLDGEGDLLLALEHLAGRILFRSGCPRDRVRVDSDGFRAGLDEALRERTRKALVESRDSGRPVTFEPLGPAERRVIHLTVEEAGGGRSRSEGSGFRRRVRIEAVTAAAEADA